MKIQIKKRSHFSKNIININIRLYFTCWGPSKSNTLDPKKSENSSFFWQQSHSKAPARAKIDVSAVGKIFRADFVFNTFFGKS